MSKEINDFAKKTADIIYIRLGCDLRHKHAEIIAAELEKAQVIKSDNTKVNATLLEEVENLRHELKRRDEILDRATSITFGVYSAGRTNIYCDDNDRWFTSRTAEYFDSPLAAFEALKAVESAEEAEL